MSKHQFLCRDARHLMLPPHSVHCCITSPPYYSLRKYTGSDSEIGLVSKRGLTGYIDDLVAVFNEVHRALRDDGTLILNIGDTYANKQLLGVPWRVAFALRTNGWIHRSDSIWHKPNGFPDAANDRPAATHEYLFVFTKRTRNYWDKYAVERKDRLSVRTVPVGRSKCKHFASYPPDLILPYIHQATSEVGCCPWCGAPWKRMVKKTRTPTRPGRNNTADDTGMAKRDRRRHVTTVETTGWQRTCVCGACGPHYDTEPLVPATILDPFAGICTTALACEWTGRDSIMVDIGQEYLDAGRLRVSTEKPPKRPGRPRDPNAPLPGQLEFPEIAAVA